MEKLVNFLAALSFFLAFSAPAWAQSPIPRSYPEIGTDFPDTDKPADQQAAEQAVANAYEAACDEGDFAACRALGLAFEKGQGRPANRPIAELLYRQACDGADGAGCLRLGRLLATTSNVTDQEMGALFVRRACRLDLLEACDAHADELAQGVLAAPDPQAVEALRRTTCERGRSASCLALARSLIAQDKTRAEQDEGRALLDRLCRAADEQACRAAAAHWRRLIMPDAGLQAAEYLSLGCDAGDALACYDRGLDELADGKDAPRRAGALPFLERACAMVGVGCAMAVHIREEPPLTMRCDNGDAAACVALGELLANGIGPLQDKGVALALLGLTCREGTPDACVPAANLAFEQQRLADTPKTAEAEAYLSRGCLAGSAAACEALADELASGARLAQDVARAELLYGPQCDSGRGKACQFLGQQAFNDPANPLMLAQADFSPDLTPEDAAAQQQSAEPQETADAEPITKVCRVNTVEFRGQTYSDRFCRPMRRVINGFAVEPGGRPWQALLWRPQVLNAARLDDSQRVLCGGAVVRQGWILTAAHCLTDEGVPIITGGHRIRLGLSDPLSREGFTYPILRVLRHPDYDPGTFAFDIALVQYDPRRAQRGSEVLPIARIRIDPEPLASRPIRVGTPVYTYGWGRTALVRGARPDVLRGARLELRDPASCTNSRKWRNYTRDHRANSVLCAAGAQRQQACFGDSGGPLISYGDADRVPTVIGVVSAGADCGTTGVPSRYMRIAHPRVIGWIDLVLGSQMVR